MHKKGGTNEKTLWSILCKVRILKNQNIIDVVLLCLDFGCHKLIAHMMIISDNHQK